MIQTVLSLLKPLSPVRPEGLPAPQMPVLAVTQIGNASLHRADGRDYARRFLFQVDAFASGRDESLSLFDQAFRLLANASFTLESCYQDYDDQNMTYRAGGRFMADALMKEE